MRQLGLVDNLHRPAFHHRPNSTKKSLIYFHLKGCQIRNIPIHKICG
ncbi:hypothetical protein MPQ_0891 [Methylovorus sp. MP688]|nr:hypothetical protein MPQ_0891 [Methylovorus sp. MP688]